MSYRLPKKEILRKQSSFTSLFYAKNFIRDAPIQAYFLYSKNEHPDLKVGFAVTRNFKRAVDRNRIKRLMREAYRLRRNTLNDTIQKKKLQVRIAFLFFDSKDKTDRSLKFSVVDGSMKIIINKVNTMVEAIP